MKKFSLNIAIIILFIVSSIFLFNLKDHSKRNHCSQNFKTLHSGIPSAGTDQTKIVKKHFINVVKNYSHFLSILNPKQIRFVVEKKHVDLQISRIAVNPATLNLISERAPPLI